MKARSKLSADNQRFASLAEKLELSEPQLGDLLGVSAAHIYAIFNGRKKPSRQLMLALESHTVQRPPLRRKVMDLAPKINQLNDFEVGFIEMMVDNMTKRKRGLSRKRAGKKGQAVKK